MLHDAYPALHPKSGGHPFHQTPLTHKRVSAPPPTDVAMCLKSLSRVESKEVYHLVASNDLTDGENRLVRRILHLISDANGAIGPPLYYQSPDHRC